VAEGESGDAITFPQQQFGFPVPPTPAEALQEFPLSMKVSPLALAVGVLRLSYRTHTLPLGWNFMLKEFKRTGWVPAPNSLYWGEPWEACKARSVRDGYFAAREWVGRWPLPPLEQLPRYLPDMVRLLRAAGFSIQEINQLP
jgi:hypothetical protein